MQGEERQAGKLRETASKFLCLFCDVRVWKNGFLYTNGAPYHGDQLGGQPQCGGSGLGRKCSFSPWLEEKKKSFPWRSVRHCRVKSAKQSRRRGTLLFYKNKIQLMTKEPEACHSCTVVRW